MHVLDYESNLTVLCRPRIMYLTVDLDMSVETSINNLYFKQSHIPVCISGTFVICSCLNRIFSLRC